MTPISAAELRDRFRALPGAERVLQAVGATGEEVYLVGGAVRDLLRGDTAALDLDLVIVGGVGHLADRLGGGVVGAIRIHDRFDTATVRAFDGVRYDLARARRETYPRPGTLPEVAPAEIEEDLARRDFTVNALALGLGGPREGELLGSPCALADLAQARLRVLHDASFTDDPTRLLRLARYAARLGFDVEPHTAVLARAAVTDGALETVSGERLGAELELAVLEEDPVAALAALHALGIDQALEPGFGQAEPELSHRALALLAGGERRGGAQHVVLAVALLGVEESRRRPLLDRLGTDAHLRDVVLEAARRGPELARTLPAEGPPSSVIDVVAGAVPEAVALAGALAQEKAASAARWLGEWSHVGPDIDGNDLIAAGMRPGPSIGAALRAALGAKLDGRAPTRETQLAQALRAVGGERPDDH